jgi:nitrogenase molybdenum-iron protein alpha chain
MSLTLMMAATIEKAVIIMHGPVGCGSTLHNLGPAVRRGKTARRLTPSSPIWISTNLKESDIIGGGERKLAEAIIYADQKYQPEVIFVVSTCAPNIIGDDSHEIVANIGVEAKAKVILLDCPGFKSRVVASAYDCFYHGLIRFLDLQPEPEPIEGHVKKQSSASGKDKTAVGQFRYDKAHTINLFNATSIGPEDEEEAMRLLAAVGFKTRVYAEYSNLDKLRKLTWAALNVSLCDIHDDYMLAFLEEKYGMPYVMGGMPLGYGGTRRWLKKIGSALGLENEAEALADKEEANLKKAIEPFLIKLKGKRLLIVGGIARVMAVSLTLKELGLEPIGFHAYHYDDSAIPFLELTQQQLPEISVAVSSQDFELFGAVRKFEPDLVISHSGTQSLLAKLGVPAIQLYDVDRPCFGYKGLYSFVKRMNFAFENTSYQKRLAAHVKFPYKEDWYKHDPYGHMKLI